MIFNVVYLTVCVFQTFIYYLWYDCFLKGIKVSRGITLLSYVGMYFLTTLPFMLFNIPILNLICSYSANLLITLIYRGSWKSKILTGTFLMVVMAMSESVVAIFTGHIGLDAFSSNDYYSIFGTVCLPFVQLVIVLLARNFKNLRNGESTDFSYWTITIILPLMSIYLFFVFYKQEHIEPIEMLCCTVVLLAVNILVFFLYDRLVLSFKIKKENEVYQMQNNYQQNQLELMNDVVEGTRKFKHDFLKHISMIDYYVMHEENEKLSAYLKEIHSNTVTNDKYIHTGNFVIDSIVNYKIQEAEKDGIHINADIKVPAELNLSAYDMNIILANLLDNSIEASRLVDDKQISLSVFYTKSALKIKVQNNYIGNVQKDGKVFLSTKKNTLEHGYGLMNVQNVVEKYDGVMNINDAESIFLVDICLFLS